MDPQEFRPKVLIVDDSRIVRVAAEKILRHEFTVIQAESGDAGWAEINADPEILTIFCDLSRPGGLGGYDLLERIRSDEREIIAGLPIIVVTGDSEGHARERALEYGASDFITKPFEPAQLLARARAHANHDRLRRQLSALKASHTQDTMTGLGNANYFLTHLRSMRGYSIRHNVALAVIRLDLLGLADKAREHGRDTIVQALRVTGRILARRIREEDVLVHLAPGRFAAICPATGPDHANNIAQRLLNTVLSDDSEAHRYGIGASAAVHIPTPAAGTDVQAIADAAHEAAERARAGGSGQLVSATPAERESPSDTARGETPTVAQPAAAAASQTSIDQAVTAMAKGDASPQGLYDELPALLEQCARLFELAPPEIAQPILERLRAQQSNPRQDDPDASA